MKSLWPDTAADEFAENPLAYGGDFGECRNHGVRHGGKNVRKNDRFTAAGGRRQRTRHLTGTGA